MDDLKKLSVERLRELARKHLGKGHSRLRTKAQLLEALKTALREPLARLRDVAESVVPHAKSKVRVVDFPPGRKGRVRADRGAPDAAAKAGAERPGRVDSGTARAKPAGRRKESSTPAAPTKSAPAA